MFKYWIASNRELLSTDNPITLKLTKDIELEAVFDVYTSVPHEKRVDNHGIIKYYPNPTSQNLNIESLKTIKTVEFFNASGVRVKTISDVNNNKITINISGLKKGLYIINITGNEFSEVIKLVVNE
jgi:hypothetical protein